MSAEAKGGAGVFVWAKVYQWFKSVMFNTDVSMADNFEQVKQ